MFRELIQECRHAVLENALNPDLHRDAVRAIARERNSQIPDLRSREKIRGRNTKKPQVMSPRGWKDVEEYGSPGRRFDAY